MAVDSKDIFREEKKPWFDFSNLSGDAYGGIVAGIVALPLGLAFGAGVFPHDPQLGATAGLWGAILVGFFAAAFGGQIHRYRALRVRWSLFLPLS